MCQPNPSPLLASPAAPMEQLPPFTPSSPVTVAEQSLTASLLASELMVCEQQRGMRQMRDGWEASNHMLRECAR